MYVECWWGSLGAFLKKKTKKRRSSRKLPLCLQDREEGKERKWVGEGGDRKQTFPHYSSKSNPAFTSWLDSVHVCPITYQHTNGRNTSAQSYVTCCPFFLITSFIVITSLRTVGCKRSSQHSQTLRCIVPCLPVVCIYTQTCFVPTASQFLCLSRLMRWKISLRLTREAFRVSSMQSSFWCKIAANRALHRMNKGSYKRPVMTLVMARLQRPRSSKLAVAIQYCILFLIVIKRTKPTINWSHEQVFSV